MSLKVTIIGAGISSLATATSLARHGHVVQVLEFNEKLSEFGAGIQITANATRILYAWGSRDAFEKVVDVPDVQFMRRYSTGEVISGVAQNPRAEDLYGFPRWAIYRPDFQAILYESALDAGAQVEFGQIIARMDIETAGVVLEDGSIVCGDLVIGADGIWSQTRSYIPENADVSPTPFREYTYRALVPRSAMMFNTLTASLATSRHANGWLGPGQLVVGYPVASGQLYNLAVAVPRSSDAPLMSRNTPGNVEES